MDEIKLSEKQIAELAQVYQQVQLVKIRIAEITEQVLIFETKRRATFDELHQAREAYKARARTFATQAGIDVDREQWELSLERGAVRRLPEAEPAPLKAVE